jgi:glycerate-2-kinase
MDGPRGLLTDIFNHAIRAVDPAGAVARHAGRLIASRGKGRTGRVIVLGFGKAVSPMVRPVMDAMGEAVTGGVAIARRGAMPGPKPDGRIAWHEAGHPLPDEGGLLATMEVMGIARQAERDDLVVCLISGGASALLVAPYPGISLVDKQRTTDLLLRAGADIRELNTVRKHLSAVKGGRLAALAFPAAVVSLILSDVIGDYLDVIASGPTAPDGTTYRDAQGVIDGYGLASAIPSAVSSLLARGARGLIPETPKPGDPLFDRVENTIVGSGRLAIDAARRRALALGLDARVISTVIRGEARDAGRWFAGQAAASRGEKGKPVCLISGGETTVTVKGSGLGGRNMELALAFALEAEGTRA